MSLQSSSVKIPLTSLRTRKCNFLYNAMFLMILLCMFIFKYRIMSLKDQNKSVPFNHEHPSFIQGS